MGAVHVAIGVGVSSGCGALGVGVCLYFKRPKSIRPLRDAIKTRAALIVVKGGGVKLGSPASMAGLPGNNAL